MGREIVIVLINIALLFSYSTKVISAPLAKGPTLYVGKVNLSNTSISIRLTLNDNKSGTLNITKWNKKLKGNEIVEFYFASIEADTLIVSGEIVYGIKYLFKRKKKSAYVYPISGSPDEVLFCDKSLSYIKLRCKNGKNTDSLFLTRIIDGGFFEQEYSEKQDYYLVIRHCVSHTNESYDEAFSDGLSRMLQRYPNKIVGLRKALKQLSPKQREEAYKKMIVYIASAWMMEQGLYSIDDPMIFYHTFPFLEKCPMIDKILK